MKEVNARIDQIPGAPPILKGPDSKKYTKFPYKPSAAPELIPKRFKMPKMPKYNGTSDTQEHITTYTIVGEYHGTNGHRTGDCRHLQEEVATTLKSSHLREFLSDRAKNNYGHNRDNTKPSKAGEEPPRQTINMIFRGNEINRVTFSAAKKTKVSIIHSKRLQEDDTTFTKEDADGLLLPHNDALRVLEQAELTKSIIVATKLLAGFNLASVMTPGEIFLLTNAEGVMKTTLFEVLDGDMGYNIILGRPWLHEMKVVPSIYHQLLKFPKPEGIKQIRNQQQKR
ncbi:PREDICTED: uncharacterized protein LOC109206746 [Nicotiana attenuata]|uniref:uncharacterized protein LOC109206746 n=1 Tax=Nicotiana attenuata TaxID=49451 RepID=UPI0009047B03|nr:PREDICTED: uncharacterized protein LOC109206746 [Nicotiana attenuata]